MSLIGSIVRRSCIYSIFQRHFVDTMILPFATSSQISVREAKFLGQLTKNLTEPGPIIEIGTLFGRSTFTICINKNTDRYLPTVDNCSWNPCELTHNQHSLLIHEILREGCQTENVDIQTLDKNDFYKKYKGPQPALVFLDSDQSYHETLKDIKWAQSVKSKVICGHDYTEDFPGVIRAVQECGGVRELTDTLWLLNSN